MKQSSQAGKKNGVIKIPVKDSKNGQNLWQLKSIKKMAECRLCCPSWTCSGCNGATCYLGLPSCVLWSHEEYLQLLI